MLLAFNSLPLLMQVVLRMVTVDVLQCMWAVLMWQEEITRQKMYVQRNIVACSLNHCWNGKAINITHTEYMSVAIVIQYAMRMRCVIQVFSSVTRLAVQNFSILSHKRNDIQKYVMEHKMLVLIFSTTFV